MDELIDRFNSVPLTNKIIVLFLVMIGLAAAYVVGLHLPMNDKIADLQQERVDLEEEIAKLDGVQERQQQVEQTLEELSNELELAKDKLPDSAEIPGLLERVYRDAELQGLTIQTFQRNPDEPAADADYVEIPVQMELVGTFDEIADFFAEVGQRGRIINIDEVQISRQGSGLEANGELQVSARATTYRWSPDGGGDGGS